MQTGGTVKRIEILPETEEEREHLQKLINLGRDRQESEPLMYWGDSDTFGGAAFIINSHEPLATPPPDGGNPAA